MARRKLTFRTAQQMCEEAPPDIPWICEPWIAHGALTEIIGKIKASGKTTFTLAMVKAITEGSQFLGYRAKQTPIVYLSEQGQTSFVVALNRIGLDTSTIVHVVPFNETTGMKWEEIIDSCKQFAQEHYKDNPPLLIIDTVSMFVGREDENDTNIALAAMDPLHVLAAQGWGILIVRHEKKGENSDVVEAGRGSSSWSGSVDVMVHLQKAGGANSPMRVINTRTRLGESVELTIEYKMGEFKVAGGWNEMEEAKNILLEKLPEDKGAAMRLDDVEGDIANRAYLNSAARELMNENKVVRIGKGQRGSPYLWYKNGNSMPSLH